MFVWQLPASGPLAKKNKWGSGRYAPRFAPLPTSQTIRHKRSSTADPQRQILNSTTNRATPGACHACMQSSARYGSEPRLSPLTSIPHNPLNAPRRIHRILSSSQCSSQCFSRPPHAHTTPHHTASHHTASTASTARDAFRHRAHVTAMRYYMTHRRLETGAARDTPADTPAER